MEELNEFYVEVDISGCYDNHPVRLLLCCITAAYGARAVL